MKIYYVVSNVVLILSAMISYIRLDRVAVAVSDFVGRFPGNDLAYYSLKYPAQILAFIVFYSLVFLFLSHLIKPHLMKYIIVLNMVLAVFCYVGSLELSLSVAYHIIDN